MNTNKQHLPGDVTAVLVDGFGSILELGSGSENCAAEGILIGLVMD